MSNTLTEKEIKDIEERAKKRYPAMKGWGVMDTSPISRNGYAQGATEERIKSKGLVDAFNLIIRKLRPCNDIVTNDIISISEQAIINYNKL